MNCRRNRLVFSFAELESFVTTVVNSVCGRTIRFRMFYVAERDRCNFEYLNITNLN